MSLSFVSELNNLMKPFPLRDKRIATGVINYEKYGRRSAVYEVTSGVIISIKSALGLRKFRKSWNI